MVSIRSTCDVSHSDNSNRKRDELETTPRDKDGHIREDKFDAPEWRIPPR